MQCHMAQSDTVDIVQPVLVCYSGNALSRTATDPIRFELIPAKPESLPWSAAAVHGVKKRLGPFSRPPHTLLLRSLFVSPTKTEAIIE